MALLLAHPDDESYSAYGTVARDAEDPDFRLVVVHATDGERGEIAPGVPVAPGGLGAWRRDEDERAWQATGVRPFRHEWLGLPDGALAEVGAKRLCRKFADVLREERPDVVATLVPNGVTGHPDHIVVSQAATEAFHQVRLEPGPGLRRLIHGQCHVA